MSMSRSRAIGVKLLTILTILLVHTAVSVAQIAIPELPPQVLLSKVLGSAHNSDTSCQKACAVIASHIPDSVFIGQSGNFKFWARQQAELVPACRVEPSSEAELSWIFKEVIGQTCHFAVKSGGHSRTPGASNVEGGVVLDMIKFNDIKLSSDKKSVVIGAGLRWVDVYQALEKEQLMVLGGRISDVGVGGLLLGGGISFLSNEHGLACDSVIAYKMMLPNTTVLAVDQRSHSALYKGLRGAGSSNFGIIISFTLEVFPLLNINGIWNGQKLFPWEDTGQLLLANHKLVSETMDVDAHIAVMNVFVCQPKHNHCYGALNSQHTTHDSINTWPKSFEPYGEIQGLPQTIHMEISPVSNVTRLLAGSSPAGLHRTIYGTFTYTPSIDLESKMLEMFREEVDTVRDMAGFLPTLIMHPLSRTMIKKMSKYGGSAIGRTIATDGPLTISNVSWQWFERIDDHRAYAAYDRLMARMERVAKELGVYHPYKYINYAEASQDVWEAYRQEDLEALKKLQKQIDPTGIFTKGGLASGYFKLNDGPTVAPKMGSIMNREYWDKVEL